MPIEYLIAIIIAVACVVAYKWQDILPLFQKRDEEEIDGASFSSLLKGMKQGL